VDQPRFQTCAVTAMESVFQRPPESQQIDPTNFCHGVAGLLWITCRFAHDTGLPLFQTQAEELAKRLLSCFTPEAPLGFAITDPYTEEPLSLLNGVTGTILTLFAASRSGAPIWDRRFLIA
jgi:lantibiotic biosynthesis protein